MEETGSRELDWDRAPWWTHGGALLSYEGVWEARVAKDARCDLPNTSSTGLFCLMVHKMGKGGMCMDDTRLVSLGV